MSIFNMIIKEKAKFLTKTQRKDALFAQICYKLVKIRENLDQILTEDLQSVDKIPEGNFLGNGKLIFVFNKILFPIK